MKNPLVQLHKLLTSPRVKRASTWPHTRKLHLVKEPYCKYCGGRRDLQVHHIVPFHIDPELEEDDANLITLCESMGRQCHLHIGHLDNWKHFNSDIREIARFTP